MSRAFFIYFLSFAFLVLTGAGCDRFVDFPHPTTSSTNSSPASSINTSSTSQVPLYFTSTYHSPKGRLTLTRNAESVSAMWDEPKIGQWTGYGSIDENNNLNLSFFREDRQEANPSLWALWLQPDKLDAVLFDETQSSSSVQFVKETNGVPLQVIHLKRESTGSQNENCLYELNYPELQSSPDIDETIRLHINQDIARIAGQAALWNVYSPPTSTSMNNQDRAEAYLQGCMEGIKELLNTSDVPDGDFGFTIPRDWYQSTSFYVTLNQQQLLSLQFGSDEYSGGAHGAHGLWSVTYDLKTGKKLGIPDLLKETQWKNFFRLAAKDILKQDDNISFLFDENKVSFEKLANDHTAMDAAERKTFTDTDHFYLTPNSIVLFYNEYEIAPYAAGQPSSELFYTSFKNMIKTGSPLERLL